LTEYLNIYKPIGTNLETLVESFVSIIIKPYYHILLISSSL